jgi:hypothetical protein
VRNWKVSPQLTVIKRTGVGGADDPTAIEPLVVST